MSQRSLSTAVNINFDSLGEMYGFPQDYKDPSFFVVWERFLSFAKKYDFKYTLYVIGKDLEKGENREVVREWAKQGHEVGNHSWSHSLGLGSLDRSEIFSEVEKSHTAITKATGIEPKGFIAPGWSGSETLRDVLIELGYEYDTSTFPSWMLYAFLLRTLVTQYGDKRFSDVLRRKDLANGIFPKRRPYLYRDKLKILPLPTNPLGVVCWHTMGFTLGWKLHFQLMRSCMKSLDSFYYLAHPGDLLAPEDLKHNGKTGLERINIPLDEKTSRFEQALQVLTESGRRIKTMRELARESC